MTAALLFSALEDCSLAAHIKSRELIQHGAGRDTLRTAKLLELLAGWRHEQGSRDLRDPES